MDLAPLSALQGGGGRDAPDAVVMSQPANPCGHYLSHEELMALATFVVEQRCLLGVGRNLRPGEPHQPHGGDGAQPGGAGGAVPGIGARTVVLGGLSKEFAAGGLRVGWMATQDRALVAALRDSCAGRAAHADGAAAAYLYAAYARGPDGRLLYPRGTGG